MPYLLDSTRQQLANKYNMSIQVDNVFLCTVADNFYKATLCSKIL